MPVKTRKKLIEVALPLDAINKASAREKSIRHGHPSTLHLWWARRPLAAARAVIFSQMVDDPSSYVDTLLGDPDTRRAAQRELKKRRALWEKRKAEYEAATGNEAVEVPEPGPEPTLEDCASEIERERRFGRAGGALARITRTTRGPKSSSTATGCRPSTIPSRAAVRCRWRRSGWG